MDRPFPDRRWGSEDSRLKSVALAFAATSLGSLAIRKLTPIDRRLMSRTNGKYTTLGPIGSPTMLLTTIGAKSGRPRTTPLVFYREDPDLFIIGSNFGQNHHPAWSANLLANPSAWVNIDGTEIEATATYLEGPARDRIFHEFEKMGDVYRVYNSRTSRELRVFRLTAV